MDERDTEHPAPEHGQDGLYELSLDQIEQIAALVYQLVCDDLRLERERSG